ncbi:hypothetical protein ACFLYU_03320, partial [Candidatus Dependentiae bacterium]
FVLNKFRILSVFMVIFFLLGTNFVVCMKKQPKKQVSEKLAKEVKRFGKIKKNKKYSKNILDDLYINYFNLVKRILKKNIASKRSCKLFKKALKGFSNQIVNCFNLRFACEKSKIKYLRLCCGDDELETIENFLYLPEHGIDFFYGYYSFSKKVVKRYRDIALKNKVKILKYLTMQVKEVFDKYLELKKNKGFELSVFVNNFVGPLTFKYAEIKNSLKIFKNIFPFFKYTFEGETVNLVKWFKKGYKLSEKKFCVSLASNAKTKKYLIEKFFSKSKKEIKKIKQKTFENIKTLKDLKIKNLKIDCKGFGVYSKFTTQDYFLSRIKIKKIGKINKNNNVFLVKLPCLQQVGGFCQCHAMVNSIIFSKCNKLSSIIELLNNSNILVDKAKNYDNNDATYYKERSTGECCPVLKRGIHDEKLYRFKINNKCYVSFITTKGCGIKKFYGTFGDEIVQSFWDKNGSTEVFDISWHGNNFGHRFCARVDRTEGGDMVIFYTDSENLLDCDYGDGAKLFLSLAKKFETKKFGN